MKIAASLILSGASARYVDVASPIAKVLRTLSECETKIIKEGESAQKVYTEYSEWCEDRYRNLDYEIKTSKAQVAEQQAIVGEETANQQVLTSKIDDLAADIATDEKDLAAATKIRNQETSDFNVEEKDLVQVIDALQRAISVIEREMSAGASMMQMKSANSLKQVFNIMVQASTMNTADAQKLTAFVQSSNDDDDFETGAPAAAVYESQSGGIVETLEGLLDTANEQLEKIRKKESAGIHNYEMLKNSLTDSIKFANSEMSEAKKSRAASQEAQATAQGDLEVTQKDLNQDTSTLREVHHSCMATATDFETETKSRSNELKGIAAAKKAIGAISMPAVSFLQVSSTEEPSKIAVHLIRNLARKSKDKSLAQLASRMASTLVISSKLGQDPLAKVREMTQDMINKLEAEAAADATQKQYCDKELAEAKEKVADKKAEVEKLSTRLEQKTSSSAKVKEETATLEAELATLIKEKTEMDALRQKEKANYDFNYAEATASLEGVKYALKVLRDFYGVYVKEHTGFSSTDGSAEGVIAMIEILESDISVAIVKMKTIEEEAVREYTAASKTFEMTKVAKEQDIKYKTREHVGLDKYARDTTTDLEGVQSELDANNEALSKLEEMCTGKAETYEERVARREEEIAGLKEALENLESEVSEGEGAAEVPAEEAAAVPAAAAPAAEGAPAAEQAAAPPAAEAAAEAPPAAEAAAAAPPAAEAAAAAPPAPEEAAAPPAPEQAAEPAAPEAFVQSFAKRFRGGVRTLAP